MWRIHPVGRRTFSQAALLLPAFLIKKTEEQAQITEIANEIVHVNCEFFKCTSSLLFPPYFPVGKLFQETILDWLKMRQKNWSIGFACCIQHYQLKTSGFFSTNLDSSLRSWISSSWLNRMSCAKSKWQCPGPKQKKLPNLFYIQIRQSLKCLQNYRCIYIGMQRFRVI